MRERLAKFLAITVMWNQDRAAEGFRLYWERLRHERECDEDRKPMHAITLGDVTRYTLSPDVFRHGEIYVIRASAYSGDYETPLSEERLCLTMDETVDDIKTFELPKKEKENTHEPLPIPQPIPEEPSAPESEPVDAPEAPSLPEAPIPSTPLESEPDDFDGWDSDVYVGTQPQEREYREPSPDRIQPVLGSQGSARVEQTRTWSNDTNSETRRTFQLFPEADPSKLAGGQGILFRANGLRDVGYNSAGIKPVKSDRVRTDQDNKASAPLWITGGIILLLAAIAFVVSYFAKKEEEKSSSD
jgi:hypothetical protein